MINYPFSEHFTLPLKPFGDPPTKPIFEASKVAVLGVPLDITTTVGKGTKEGPDAMRYVSAELIETFRLHNGRDFYEDIPLVDLGNLKIPEEVKDSDDLAKKLDILREISKHLLQSGKVPLILGGEHLLSYWTLRGAAQAKDFVVIHIDAHRDAKKEYLGKWMSHTTPMYWVIKDPKGIPGKNFMQIGIRQTDKEENDFAESEGIQTIYPWDVRKDLQACIERVEEFTNGRNVYVTMDIDGLDSAYTPATGTPVSFGINPWDMQALLDNISGTLIGFEMVEVGKDPNFREAEIAVQIILNTLHKHLIKE